MWLVFVFLGGDFEAMERMARDEDDNRDCSPQRAKQSYSRTLEMRLMEFLVQQDLARNREHRSNPLVGQMTLYMTLLFLTFFMVWLFNLGSHWYQLHARNGCCSFPPHKLHCPMVSTLPVSQVARLAWPVWPESAGPALHLSLTLTFGMPLGDISPGHSSHSTHRFAIAAFWLEVSKLKNRLI